MGGSWKHMTTPGGRFRNNRTFCETINNLGDAYEVAEECYGMIWWLATMLAKEKETSWPSREKIMAKIQDAEKHYGQGLRRGGKEPPSRGG